MRESEPKLTPKKLKRNQKIPEDYEYWRRYPSPEEAEDGAQGLIDKGVGETVIRPEQNKWVVYIKRWKVE